MLNFLFRITVNTYFLRRTLVYNATSTKQKTALRRFCLVEVARLELAASWSLTMRATNCATPRYRNGVGFAVSVVERKTGIEPATFSLGSYCSTIEPFPHPVEKIISLFMRFVKLFCRYFKISFLPRSNKHLIQQFSEQILAAAVRVFHFVIQLFVKSLCGGASMFCNLASPFCIEPVV